MAAGDIAGRNGFIEVFPISTRGLAIWLVWISQGGTGRPDVAIYPPETDTLDGGTSGEAGKTGLGIFADDLDDPSYPHDYSTPDTVQYSDGLTSLLPRRSYEDPELGDDRFEVGNGLLYFDLSGAPPGPYSRAELICVLSALSVNDSDGRALVADWHHSRSEYAGAEPISVDADYTSSAPGGSVIQPVDLTDIVAVSEDNASPSYPDRFPPQPSVERWAIPIRNLAPLNRQRSVGLRLHISGGEPSGLNTVTVGCNYASFDASEAASLSERAMGLPHLRLWVGGMDAPPATVTINMQVTGRAQPFIEQRTHEHIAGRERDRAAARRAHTRRP